MPIRPFRQCPEARQLFIQQFLPQTILTDWIVSMPAEILRNIFEFGNLEKLCAIARCTDSPRLQGIAHEYFYSEFQTKMIAIKSMNGRIQWHPIDLSTIYFCCSIRNVVVYGANFTTFNYVGRMWPTRLTRITFSDTLGQVQLASGAPELIDCVRTTMENVQMVKFRVKRFNGRLCDLLLASTRNMSQLVIAQKERRTKTKIRSKQSNGYKNIWFFRQYPELRRIEWNDGIVNHPDGFKLLLNLNKKLKHLTFTKNIERVLEFLEKTEPFFEPEADWIEDLNESLNFKIRNLQRLDIGLFLADVPNIARICSRLNDLYEDGCYHQLFITSANRSIFENDLVASLRGLTGITINGPYVPSMERAPLLRELTVAKIGNGGTAAAKHLGSLEKLKIRNASIRDIRPFISHAPNIREISIKYVQREPFDCFDALNELREKLPNARTLVIYLEEWAYIALKQHSATPKKVEIRRIEALFN